MANVSRAAEAAERVPTTIRDSADQNLEPSWHGSRRSFAELSEDDMWRVVEGDLDDLDDDDTGADDDDDDDDDDDWDWDDDEDDDFEDDDWD
jgi:hypothetical protein